MSARRRILEEALTEIGLEKEMQRILPKRNKYCSVNYAEIVQEARSLGLTTRGKVRRMLLRHRKQMLEIDREPIDPMNIHIYTEDMGYERVKELTRRQMWFGWEALFRLALELEFGGKYVCPSVTSDGG